MHNDTEGALARVSTHTVKLLLTVPEVALALGVGRSVVYELLLVGEIQSVKIGRARRVPVKSLEDYIARLLSN